MSRQKDIQYASRAKSHVARQKQIHHLRHIIRERVAEGQSNKQIIAWMVDAMIRRCCMQG